MGHIQIFGEQLREKLHSRASDDELIVWVKEQVLKSYRNGLAAGREDGRAGDKRPSSARRRGEYKERLEAPESSYSK